MSLIQYTSDEMFSATDLVRKNKFIFDKIQSKEIEKAVILRDGKPAMILFDFVEYERIMRDYIALKNQEMPLTSLNIKTLNSDCKELISSENRIEEENISEEDFQNALEQIKSLGIIKDENIEECEEEFFSFDKNTNIEEKTSQKLKDFWDK